jgi:tRNA threonylcarbamoyladenosine biosynthesis protein TsaE
MLLLSGDLGAGKTHFTKGVVAGIGSHDSVTSPTFVFINEYRGPHRLPIYHVDLYRITTDAELVSIGIDDVTDGSGICIIEWHERDARLYELPHIAVHIAHAGTHLRRITCAAHGVQPVHTIQAWADTPAIRHLQESAS